jgi:hypothetical protein
VQVAKIVPRCVPIGYQTKEESMENEKPELVILPDDSFAQIKEKVEAFFKEHIDPYKLPSDTTESAKS